MTLNGERIAKGSNALWLELEQQLEKAADDGLMN